MSFFTKPRHLFPFYVEVALGVLLFVVAIWFIYQAYDGRNKKKPWFFGPFMPY